MTKQEFIEEITSFGFKKDLRLSYDRYNYGSNVCVILSEFTDEPKVRFWGTDNLRKENKHLEIDSYEEGLDLVKLHVVMDS